MQCNMCVYTFAFIFLLKKKNWKNILKSIQKVVYKIFLKIVSLPQIKYWKENWKNYYKLVSENNILFIIKNFSLDFEKCSDNYLIYEKVLIIVCGHLEKLKMFIW